LYLRKNEFNIPTFENGKNYSIGFEISNNSPIFDSIRNEKTLFAHHYEKRPLQYAPGQGQG